MIRRLLVLSLLLLGLAGCTRYVLYEIPYCIEAVDPPLPPRVGLDGEILLSALPCESAACRRFVIEYQQEEIVRLQRIGDWMDQTDQRLRQYQARNARCRAANRAVQAEVANRRAEWQAGRARVERIAVPEIDGIHP